MLHPDDILSSDTVQSEIAAKSAHSHLRLSKSNVNNSVKLCHICGNHFSKAALPSHQRLCVKKTVKSFNCNSETWNPSSTHPCTNCMQQVPSNLLQSHLRSCRGLRNSPTRIFSASSAPLEQCSVSHHTPNIQYRSNFSSTPHVNLDLNIDSLSLYHPSIPKSNSKVQTSLLKTTDDQRIEYVPQTYTQPPQHSIHHPPFGLNSVSTLQPFPTASEDNSAYPQNIHNDYQPPHSNNHLHSADRYQTTVQYPNSNDSYPPGKGNNRNDVAESGGEIQRVACPSCERKFAPDVLERHVPSCTKLKTKKRAVFNAQAKRVHGTEMEKYVAKSNTDLTKTPGNPGTIDGSNHSHGDSGNKYDEEPILVKKKKPKKPKQTLTEPSTPNSNPLNNPTSSTAISASTTHAPTQPTSVPAPAPASVPPKPKRQHKFPPQPSTEDYITCPTCTRRFGQEQSERHIPWCKSQSLKNEAKKSAKSAKSVPPNGGPGGSGVGGGGGGNGGEIDKEELLKKRVSYQPPLPGRKGKSKCKDQVTMEPSHREQGGESGGDSRNQVVPSTSMVSPLFCSACGNRFPTSQAKFCFECGNRRG
ncbi:hypothetical protein BKA69DRAFT_53896 [Paraphysoderma sedebokerense]|nr:hypothetical protein BKA69DRAFT_53896 [Paraphysoderma sedebokerense]